MPLNDWVATRFIAVLMSYGIGCLAWAVLFAWMGYDVLVLVAVLAYMIGTFGLWIAWHMGRLQ